MDLYGTGEEDKSGFDTHMIHVSRYIHCWNLVTGEKHKISSSLSLKPLLKIAVQFQIHQHVILWSINVKFSVPLNLLLGVQADISGCHHLVDLLEVSRECSRMPVATETLRDSIPGNSSLPAGMVRRVWHRESSCWDNPSPSPPINNTVGLVI